MKALAILPWPAENLWTLPEGVDFKALDKGVPLHGFIDVARNEHLFMEACIEAEKDGYDAVINLCFSDCGVEFSRKLVDIPVLGCTKVGLHTAAILGRNLCILQPDYADNNRTTQNAVDSYGMNHCTKIVDACVDGFGILNALQQYYATGEVTPVLEKFTDAAIKAIEKDHADVLLFGAGALIGGAPALSEQLKKRGYDIPVVDGLDAALGLAKTLREKHLTQSRNAYPKGEWF